MDDSARQRRWPAYTMAVLFLGYAAGKAVLAVQHRLGFPGGPPVSAAETARYARDFMAPATAQWLATASGVVGACLALATVTRLGRRVPRTLMLPVLAGMFLAVASGAGIMMLDGFVGIGVGWRWYHGLLGLVVIGLQAAMIRSYLRATRRRVGSSPGALGPAALVAVLPALGSIVDDRGRATGQTRSGASVNVASFHCPPRCARRTCSSVGGTT
ncbi:hypothetical protein ACGFI9_29660 [Micromonospora sp. NPDC048930]|uniref:hypothetical protein n=1 Tax=Micromonospora sp. NPDC048930 TaxID=3364261 RepID=UPI00371183E5